MTQRGRPMKGGGSTVISVSLPSELVAQLRKDGVSPSRTIRLLLAENIDRVTPMDSSTAQDIYYDIVMDTIGPELRTALHKVLDKVLDEVFQDHADLNKSEEIELSGPLDAKEAELDAEEAEK